jgi:hypothetical protein
MLVETLSILVHANSKVGKSTLGATCPPPMCILDAEGSTKFLPIRKTFWDPTQGPPPTWDGTWDACIVIVRDFETMRMVHQWLSYGAHNFRSIVLDSISEVQRKFKQALVGTEAMKIQDWGRLLDGMDSVIRGYRDLTQHPTNPIQVAMFIAETREVMGKWRPYLQGQITVALPYWVDVCGYLSAEPWFDQSGQPVMDAMGQQQLIRRLLVAPHPQYETGERVQGRLPHVIWQPNVTEMLLQVYPHLQQPQPQQQQGSYT